MVDVVGKRKWRKHLANLKSRRITMRRSTTTTTMRKNTITMRKSTITTTLSKSTSMSMPMITRKSIPTPICTIMSISMRVTM